MINFRKQNRLTADRVEYFGQVQNGKMELNELGEVAKAVWVRTPSQYSSIGIDEFIVMPNHIHGIIIIQDVVQAPGLRPSLSQVVGSYKNVVTKLARQKQKEFSWQPSFYDHVIRKDESLDKIREYIFNNPLKWELDRNNLSNLWM